MLDVAATVDCSEKEGQLGEGQAAPEENILNVGVLDKWQHLRDFLNFGNLLFDHFVNKCSTTEGGT